MDALVVYATGSGYTTSIAEWVQDELQTLGHAVTCADVASNPTPGNYDVVVAGSGIRAQRPHANWSGWVERYRETLGAKPLATFSVSLEVANPAEHVAKRVAGYTLDRLGGWGLTPIAHATFGGAYDPARFSMAERLMMRAMNKADPVDIRDEPAVRAWAHTLPSLMATAR